MQTPTDTARRPHPARNRRKTNVLRRLEALPEPPAWLAILITLAAGAAIGAMLALAL